MKQSNLQKLIDTAGAGHRPAPATKPATQGTRRAFEAEGMKANPDGTFTAHDGGNHDRNQKGN